MEKVVLADDIVAVQKLGHAALKVCQHPKFAGLSPAAAWLWLRGLMYLTAGNGLAKGLITDVALKDLGGTEKRVEELVRAGLWRRDVNGWRMRRLDAPVPPEPEPTRLATVPAAEPQTEVMRFPTIGEPGYWVLTQEQVDAWQKTFTSLNVLQECRYAKSWVEADPPMRRKTARGMPRFLVSWLSRAVDRARVPQAAGRTRGAGLTGPAPAGKYDHLSRTADQTDR